MLLPAVLGSKIQMDKTTEGSTQSFLPFVFKEIGESGLTSHAKSKKHIKTVEVTSSLQMHGFALVKPGSSSTFNIDLDRLLWQLQ